MAVVLRGTCCMLHRAHSICAVLLPLLFSAADDLVHIVFGFSKDFCASGLRVGCLYSKNEALNRSLDNIAYFHRQVQPDLAGSTSLQQIESTAWLTVHLLQDSRVIQPSCEHMHWLPVHNCLWFMLLQHTVLGALLMVCI